MQKGAKRIGVFLRKCESFQSHPIFRAYKGGGFSFNHFNTSKKKYYSANATSDQRQYVPE
jgi:hypothetical protein